ncbi:MAG: DUF1566 domain-containing protein [Nitrospira sp.]|nr:DUF1566 domain-containing protein [Nitrospira sp.]
MINKRIHAMHKTKHIFLMTVIFILFLPVFALSGTVDLPKTGQTTCYDSAGSVITCTGTGQDGELQRGVAWPNPRFTDNGDSTVTDNLTGLVWTKDGNAPGPVACSPAGTKTWQAALDYVACLNANSYLGYTDWRLPNINELKSLLVHSGQYDTFAWLNANGFNNVQSAYYWSSTSSAYSTNYAWIINRWGSNMNNGTKSSSYNYYVWPVRSGQSWLLGNATIAIPETGQTSCYDSSGNVITCAGTGQDGDLQRGVAWPNPRFTDNGDSTVTDNLTRLAWTKDGNAPGPAACSPGNTKTWQVALDYVACLNANSYLGYTDWRLPNINELQSIVHAGQSVTATWLNAQGFNNVLSNSYWSSTSDAANQDGAKVVDMWDGRLSFRARYNSSYVWPVRTGQVGSADLVVSVLTAPLTTAPGEYILLSETTKNMGTSAADVSTAKYYWSAYAVLDSSDVLLGSRSIPSLTPGAISSGTTSVSIPAPYTCSSLKTFYIKAKADADGVIAESNENNNKRNKSIKMGPDLIIPVFTAPFSAGAGKTIIISDTTMNLGGCTAGASTTKFYLSADTILDSGDTLLGSRAVTSLTSGDTSSGSTSVIIPAGTATGRYYIIAWSDADNVVAETSEVNNKKVRAINILPDLIVYSLSAPGTAGAGTTISISDTTKNIGGSTAAASTIRFYLSTNTTYDAGDTLLGSRPIASLAAGATDAGTTSVTIPTGTLSGTYYIIGRADADAVVAETNETNNNKSRLITVP